MYKKFRYALWFAAALLKKYRVHVGVGLLVGCTSFFIIPKILQVSPIFKPEQRVGIIGRFSSGDLPLSVQRRISIGLTTIAPNGLPAPGMASDWTVSPDGKTYTFTLKSNQYWSDGSPVKSSDIQYNFKDATVQYPDDSHLVLNLVDPYAALPTAVSRPVLRYSGHRIYGVGKYYADKIKLNGPYVESLFLYTSDQNLPTIKYNFYTTQTLAKTAFKLGLVSSLVDLADINDMKDWPNLLVHPDTHTDRYVAAFFNTQDPQLTGAAGKNLRLALSYATDKSVYDKDIRALGPISSTSWAYNSELKSYDLDIPHAKELLKKVELIPELTISTLPAYLPTAEKLQNDWKAIGITSKIQVVPDIPTEYQILLVAQAIPADPDQYNLWHSTQIETNLTALKNPRIDKLLEDGRKTIDIAARKKIYLDFQKFLLDDAPAVFLYYPQTFSLSRK